MSEKKKQKISTTKKKLNICMLCTFFYPNTGGVESHIYYLSQCLISLGHKVIIVTLARNNYTRGGVRYMLNGLKVYYLPLVSFGTRYGKSSFFGWWTTLPYLRDIFIREEIEIVHGHQGTSMLTMEGLIITQYMGMRSVFTEHSLIGFGELPLLFLNKTIKLCLRSTFFCICCSHISKENLCLRSFVHPKNVYVIPHAIDSSIFKPINNIRLKKDNDKIVIIIVMRLTERKGADLLLSVIPELCKRNKKVKFIIAGDGEKRIDFEEMIEAYNLHSKIEMLGMIQNSKIPLVLNRGDIFLNSSLTEVFCIAILEAASCGLYCVATRVGGVPEILPKDMISLCDANPKGMLESLQQACIMYKKCNKKENHERIMKMYNWNRTAKRTEVVYEKCMKREPSSLMKVINDQWQLGVVCGKVFFIYIMFGWLILMVLRWLKPDDRIDKAIDCRVLKGSHKKKK